MYARGNDSVPTNNVRYSYAQFGCNHQSAIYPCDWLLASILYLLEHCLTLVHAWRANVCHAAGNHACDWQYIMHACMHMIDVACLISTCMLFVQCSYRPITLQQLTRCIGQHKMYTTNNTTQIKNQHMMMMMKRQQYRPADSPVHFPYVRI
jgi:hypothetical protein